ncbi:response regulator [Sphingobium sp. TKS]|uniref:response regulator n=1 Tax=Sphingobium sp. TKS TaxID=1315974 RepID=UPI0007701C1E|nr:response regulator [Sphingobium sp. TKS]AMK26206.1 multi-sensor hybrid histidine kinase [Sphingobium sp. TKS]
MRKAEHGVHVASRVKTWSMAGLLLGLAFFLISGATAYLNIQALRESDQSIRHTHSVLSALDKLRSTLQDAETGQRGYLLTGAQTYLEPYRSAVAELPRRLDGIARLTGGNPVQQASLEGLRRHIEAKLAELDESIAASRAGDMAAALATVRSDRGKIEMDAIRARLDTMAGEEMRLRQVRIGEMASASRTAVTSSLISALLGAGLTIAVFILVRRNSRARVREEWLQAGQLGLADAMQGDQTVEALGTTILAYLSRYLGFEGGALFKGEGGTFLRVATLGVPPDADMPAAFGLGEGLLGQVAADGDPIVLHDLSDRYLTIGSAFGRDQPRHLVIVPGKVDGKVNAVMELGFFDPVDERILDFLDQASGSMGMALRSARFRTRLQDALEETQRQAGELQAQSEELRVSNEELEEQGRALKETQVRLEQQQVELEQTNSELEQQTQALESQRDQLERSAASLALKARELEQASQYKSDFLANMSHELRTPLNSLLILSKLLGDNPDGSLSAEQVRYARTIESSGNDLLTLINDILDLSKIEAGHVQIQPETVSIQRLAGDIRQQFTPIAEDRGLSFEIVLAQGAPGALETDRLRIEQVLRNLLSNAFKFTERGGVRLAIAPAADGRIAFAVEDSGIGISPDQQQSIFEAFQQADGTINRRYGGTGLGLSISRELARLLGGAIDLESEPGKGSTFTLTVPLVYDPAGVTARSFEETATARPVSPSPAPPQGQTQSSAAQAVPAPHWTIEDDRGSIAADRKLLLVIEDDKAFASIVRDLSREMGFQCIIATTAGEAVDLAGTFRPSAIVLDLGLPDQSGLTVLDRLKHDDETRHIPIHVISAADQSQTALSLGAVGYHVKPIRREELAQVLAGLQAKLSTRMRRVLIVEDDPVQREAVGKLLLSDDVETVAVGTAAECLEQLRRESFDCMVLDLTLPDTSGYTLLETLSQDEDRAFPPVIVYTGHDLSPDDEQRLRRYSSSIIIKGAKSPERLLDEVSLFLHQVVAELPPEQRRMIQKARHRDAMLEGRRILLVEDDIRNVYSLSSVLEPRGALIEIARNGQEAINALEAASAEPGRAIDLVLMDVMMPVMDGLAATRLIRADARWTKLPIVMLTAKAMPDDQQHCLEAGANDYMAKPIDVDKLLSLVRVWMPR